MCKVGFGGNKLPLTSPPGLNVSNSARPVYVFMPNICLTGCRVCGTRLATVSWPTYGWKKWLKQV